MWSAAYLALIVAVNFGFSYAGMMPLPFGAEVPAMTLAVGFVFVARDFAQREIGHRVLIVMAAGVALSVVLGDPRVALASGIAFAASEALDWLVYSITRRPFSDRVLLSSITAVPVDSAAFLLVAGFYSTGALVAMTAVKMAGALLLFAVLRGREAGVCR